MDYRKNVMDQLAIQGNKVCIDCGAHAPQWASVSLGTYFCLECSGIHRSLVFCLMDRFAYRKGVHISFVRSVTMDKWSEVQAKRMSLGGNEKALTFFKAHPDYRENMPIPEKYQSEFAIFYKEKLTALCDGVPWKMPEIGSKRPVAPPVSSFDNAVPSQHHGLVTNINGALPSKSQNENFFASKGVENMSRPDDIPPSQGGKYVGFGSEPYDPSAEENDLDDPVASIAKGWSAFSSFAMKGASIAISGAETLGKTVSTTVIKPTTSAVRDPNFQQNVWQKFSEISSKGIQLASEAANKGMEVATTVSQNTYATLNNYSPVEREGFVSGDKNGNSWNSDWQEPDGWENEKSNVPENPQAHSLGGPETTKQHSLDDGWISNDIKPKVTDNAPLESNEWADF